MLPCPSELTVRTLRTRTRDLNVFWFIDSSVWIHVLVHGLVRGLVHCTCCGCVLVHCTRAGFPPMHNPELDPAHNPGEYPSGIQQMGRAAKSYM